MAGKSFALVPTLALAIAMLTSCPSNISQKANSGKDYRSKGAKKIRPDGKKRWRSSRDVVTYPGGDREDWKVLEIPEGTPPGNLSVSVKFTNPRPRLDVAFQVYDQYMKRIGRAKPSKGDTLADRGIEGDSKTVKINGVTPGKYFVRIYAHRRTDAGKYRVTAKFSEKKLVVSLGDTEIPEPPKLAAVPDVPIPVDAGPVVVEEPKPCPNDPNRMQPDCTDKVEPMKGRIVEYTVSARGGIVITVLRGTNDKVDKGWKGRVVDKSGNKVEGGDFVVTSVNAKKSKGKVTLSVDQVKANKQVILSPP